jgi:hypothetical protein
MSFGRRLRRDAERPIEQVTDLRFDLEIFHLRYIEPVFKRKVASKGYQSLCFSAVPAL